MNIRIKQIKLPEQSAGFALLITLIILAVLASVTAALATRLTMAKRRQQYMIEYQRARYGLDSAIKYMTSEIHKMNTFVQPRRDKPDFSDLFWMNEQEFAQFINAWAADATDEQIKSIMKEGASLYKSKPVDTVSLMSKLASLFGGDDTELPEEPNTLDPMSFDEDMDYYVVELDPNDFEIPGPYGPPWPYVTEPMDIEIGPCHVTAVVEDENAKMPLSWFVATYKEDDKRAGYALETFGEWMQMSPGEIKELQSQCDDVSEKKQFVLNANPILIKKSTRTSSRSSAARRFRTSRSRRTSAKSATTSKTVSQQRPAIAHTTDFAKLFHSSLLNREELARSVPGTGQRLENALKYLSLSGSQHVNVNTAPRHVLEAAFTFATEPVELAHQVILQRQDQPFIKLDDIKELGLLDTETFNKMKNYITARSTFFKVTITSRSGNATASAVVTIVKEAQKTQVLMVLYD